MRFKIPRYIDYEAKIFGPASFKQFLFLLAGMMVIGFLWLITERLFTFLLFSIIVTVITGGLAFGKINGRPVLTMIGKYISFTFSGSKTYFWKKKEIPPKIIQKEKKENKKNDDDKKLPTSRKKGGLDEVSKKIEIS